jgi:anti-sigma-K factor RskA
LENIKEYIESGILELYVLGDLSSAEMAEVEAVSKLYPEVKTELEEIEQVMVKVADNFTLEPSSSVKENFFASISFSDNEEKITETKETVIETRVIPMNNSRLNFYKFALAACVALLLVSVVAIVNLNRNLQDSRQQIAQLETSNQSFANRVNYLDERASKSDEVLSVFTNADYKMVSLVGTPAFPESKILVAWNAKEQKVMIDLKSMKMPKNDQDHQYQLWALVDGKPVDLGVFDADDSSIGLKTMKSIGALQTFAVTLEPRGGSVSPTLEKLMVLGNI